MLDAGIVNKIGELLTTDKIETSVVNTVLKIICESLCFDVALIYEIDQESNFFLSEHLIIKECFVHQHLSSKELESASYKSKDNSRLIYITKDSSSKELLEKYQASSLLLFNLMDESAKKIGQFIFYNVVEKPKLLPQQLQLASIVLHMVSRYVEVRILQRKLTFSQNSFESIMDNTGIDIYVNDFYNHDILYVNKSMAAPYGGVDKFKSRKCHEVLFPEQNGPCSFCPQKQIIDEEGNPTKTYTWDYKRAMDGEWFRVFSSAFRWTDGRLGHVVSSANITDNKRNEELIAYMANYDSLTKLPNRRKLMTDLEKIISEVEHAEKYILFFDIDGFKKVNDDLGHDAGDELLVQLGAFFAELNGMKDNVYRHGGDEFVAIIDGKLTKEEVATIIDKIHQRFSKVWTLKKGDVKCNTSVGIAKYPIDGNTVDALLYQADQAMYKIKKEGGGSMHFNQ